MKNKFNLFIVSFLILFVELALIRYLSANIHMLGYFSNTVLLASFLGMGLGCLIKNKFSWFDYVYPLLIITLIIVAIIFYHKHIHLNMNAINSKHDVFFGSIFYPRRVLKIPVFLVLGLIFISCTAVLIYPGRYFARYFSEFRPLQAYKINILGSIAGIVVFSIFSYFSVGPLVWFAVSLIIGFYLLDKNLLKNIIWILCLTVSMFLLYNYEYNTKKEFVTWSPYYKVNLSGSVISVNNMNHQQMQHPEDKESFLYNYPYLILKKFNKNFENVLIIGAGSGNDVSAAINNGVKKIDAVEIDPEIIKIGEKKHPFQPYKNNKVTLYCNDGRAFLKNTNKKYDVIIYALVDSLTLQSTYSNIRLENYLFTMEAFKDVKKSLKKNGIFIVYNTFRENWLAIKIYDMLEKIFNNRPVMTVYPAKQKISIDDTPHSNLTTFIVSNSENDIGQIFNKKHFLFLNNVHKFQGNNELQFKSMDKLNEYIKYKNSIILFNTQIQEKYNLKSSTDDWPFLYLRAKNIPKHNFKGIVLILLLSLIMIFPFIKIRDCKSDNIVYFLLGIAFMLLETKSITVFALAFGTTWIVNSIVFFGILIIVFIANYYIIKKPKFKFNYLYLGIIITLIISRIIPIQSLLTLPFFIRIITIIILTFLPIFFASMLFSRFFENGSNSVINLAFNLFGIIVGGLLENLSLLTGYNNLIFVILVLYCLTYFFKKKIDINYI